jgi:succinoglycan biosynthesis protein ExoO
MPYVSVIIPAYNAAEFIIDAYRSVAEQTLDDWEIILVNSASQDDTPTIVKSLAAADKRVKVIDLPVNLGPGCARNAALAIAEGDWIAILDADDRYSSNRLEVLTDAAERSAADIVLDNLFVIDPLSKRVMFLAFEMFHDELKALEFSDYLRNAQSDTFFHFGYLKPIIRRRWLLDNDIKYQEQLRLGEDSMLLFECYARRARVMLVSKPYYHYYFQYSPTNKTKSATTRTELSYEPLLAAVEQFLDRHRLKQSRLECRLLGSVCETLRETMVVATLKAGLKRRDPVRLVSCLRHPIRLLRGVYFDRKRASLFRRRAKTAAPIGPGALLGRGD